MAQYYKDHLPAARNNTSVVPAEATSSTLSEFDKLGKMLLTDDADEGWAAELRRYLGTMQREVR